MATLHIVHCIDTEGPLTETCEATIARVNAAFGLTVEPSLDNLLRLQRREIALSGLEEAVARMVDPHLLNYNNSWERIHEMLDELLSESFRSRLVDSFGQGWVYSWHCLDHLDYIENPRRKDVGYGKVFRFYRQRLAQMPGNKDELNWHFHPRSLTGDPLHCATSYLNTAGHLLHILARRILEDNWFPVVNRPGFHAERGDSHLFLEQWMPFDYANQFYEDEGDQPDVQGGRFGDWRRATASWRGYHPAHDDYQQTGHCRRLIFRCLNIGTRLRELRPFHLRQAFLEARQYGKAIMAFTDHDFRDIRCDVARVRLMIQEVYPEFTDVKFKFSGAEEAARDLLDKTDCESPILGLSLQGVRLQVKLEQGQIFGPQPFLALRSRDGKYFHDNLDIQEPGRIWTYICDGQTLPLSVIDEIGVGTAGQYGGYHVAKLKT